MNATAIDNATLTTPPVAFEKLLWVTRQEKKQEDRILPRQPVLKKAQHSVASRVAAIVKRKRAPRTCTECHRRKIRCDVAYRGDPCYKCQFYERKCIPTVTGRKKALQERVKDAIEKAGLGSNRNTTSPVLEAPPAPLKRDETAHSSLLSSDFSCTFSDQRARSDITDITQTSCYDTGSGLRKSRQSELPPSTTDRQVPQHLSITRVLTSNTTFPDIFERFPSHIDAADVEYLKSRRALALPSQALQNHLFQTYTRFVHRNLPILDLQHIFTTINREEPMQQLPENENSGRIPLLLFLAVMFAAVAYADIDILQSSGYKSRQIAQERFYKKVRALYDLNTCTDRLSTAQSALLIALGSTARNLEPPGRRDSWYWLGIATSLSYTLALNRNEPGRSISRRESQLRRRTWWTVVVLDRLLCMCPSHDLTSRSHRISHEDCYVEMLTPDDFDLKLPCFNKDDEFNEVQMSEDAFNFIDTALICWYGHDLALYRYPSSLQAAEDVRMSTFLRDEAAEESTLARVASYTFPISEQTEGIVILSAVI